MRASRVDGEVGGDDDPHETPIRAAAAPATIFRFIGLVPLLSATACLAADLALAALEDCGCSRSSSSRNRVAIGRETAHDDISGELCKGIIKDFLFRGRADHRATR